MQSDRFVLKMTALLAVMLAPLVAQADPYILQQEEGHAVMVATSAGPVTLRTTDDAVQDLSQILVPGSTTRAVLWQELQGSQAVPYYAVTLDGVTFSRAKVANYGIALRYGSFDPLEGTPTVPAHLDSSLGGELWIVQYWTQGLETYRNGIRELGGEIHLHLPYQANVVSMDSGTAAQVALLPYVRWVGTYQPAYRLDEVLLQEQVQGFSATPVQKVNILSLRRGLLGQNPIAARIRALGGTVDLLDPHTWRMEATLGLGQIAELARMDEVQWMEHEAPGRFSSDMDIARQFGGAVQIFNAAGFDGTGVRGEVSDTGIQASHPEFAARPLIQHGGLSSSSHGTSTYGQIFASGVNAQAKGLCYMGQGVGNSASSWSGGTEYNHTTELSNPNLIYRCVTQTFSGFSPLTTQYTADSQTTDLILFDNSRMTMTQSQSNQNSQNSRARAWAKNCVAVGGIDHVNTLTVADDNTSGASIGPAADGRIKPELASFYDNIFTTTTTSTYTTGFGGTSGATPIVCGHFGLFYQMWHAGIFGNPTGSDVFDSRPQNTTARAFVIAAANAWTQPGIQRRHQGWGHPSVINLYDNRTSLFYVDETDLLTNLQTSTHNLTVPSGTPSLRATLCWRDNPGTTSSTHHLINDLDLKVTSPSGTVYWGNNGMGASTSTATTTPPGGGPDTINSLENVFINNPQAGNWTVEIIGSDINQDNHVETAILDADYALCVIGVLPLPPPNVFSMSMTSAGGDLTFGLDNIPAGTTEGFCIFADNSTQALGQGPLLGIYPTPLSFLSFTLPKAPGFPLHWTWPVVGIFPDTDFMLPPGSVTTLLPLDGVGLAVDPGYSITGVTSVRRVP